MTRVSDVKDPRDRVGDINRRLTANADEIKAVIATAEREQRSDLSRREQARYEELLLAELTGSVYADFVLARLVDRRAFGAI